MAKSHSFSVYLLKKDYDADKALKADHGLLNDVKAKSLPEGARIFVLDGKPHPPWWREYFGIEKDLNQVSKGALVFLEAKGRRFALCHGHVAHNLKDESYEYDFGLRVTLNCVDPKELKSTDSLDPGLGRRQRTQLPIGSDLTLFEFDRDSSILRRLTGKVKKAHKELLKHATGASNLRISSDISAQNLTALCGELLNLYEDETYKTTFPDIQNIKPVNDPDVIAKLDQELVDGFKVKSDKINLTVPELISYSDNVYARFGGLGPSLLYDDVFVDAYYDYLAKREFDLSQIALADLKRHELVLTNEDGSPRDSFSIYKATIFDTALDADGDTFHFCEGHWYKVDGTYSEKLKQFLDPHCADVDLIPYNHDSEGAYNQAAAIAASIVCLDTKNIAPQGQTSVEPCDLYYVDNGIAVFCSVKISTLSATLSHLFNQGTNAIELIRVEPEALQKLKALIKAEVAEAKHEEMTSPLDENQQRVRFIIITHKDKAAKSDNLPLFSRISLMRNLKALRAMGVSAQFGFVSDETIHGDGKKVKRKKKNEKAADA